LAGPDPAVARVRAGVRDLLERLLTDGTLTPGALLLVACSGGADSVALASQTAFLAPRLGLRAGAVVVDHGLRPESAAVVDRASTIHDGGALGSQAVVHHHRARAQPEPGCQERGLARERDRVRASRAGDQQQRTGCQGAVGEQPLEEVADPGTHPGDGGIRPGQRRRPVASSRAPGAPTPPGR